MNLDATKPNKPIKTLFSEIQKHLSENLTGLYMVMRAKTPFGNKCQ